MPRKGKGSKKTKARRSNVRHQIVANYWDTRIRAGKEARKAYLDQARATLDSLRSRHKLTFSGELKEQFINFSNGGSEISVPKPAQVLQSLSPHLNITDPHRRVVARSPDGVMIGLARVLEAYLNYTPSEADLPQETRRAVSDAIVRGRGFVLTQWDDILEVVTSRYVSSRNVLIDPDVEHIDDAQWVAYRRVEPLWAVKRRVEERNRKDKWRVKDLKANMAPDGDGDKDSRDTDVQGVAFSNDLVESWVIYSRMGSGFRGRDFNEGQEDSRRYDDGDDFVQLEVAPEHDIPLFEGDWDIPLYLDRGWPLEGLDLVDSVDQLWPESIEGLAAPLGVAIDQCASILMTSVKNRGRTVILGDAGLEVEKQRRIKQGGMAEYIPVKLAGAKAARSLKDHFHVVEFGSISPEVPNFLMWLTQEYETTTGVTAVLSGAPTSGAEDRSATKTQQRAQASGARVDDWRNKVRKWSSRVARNEAIYVRLELDDDEVADFVTPDQIGLFFPRVETPDGSVLPLRDFGGGMSVMSLLPDAAQFFEDPQQTAVALVQLWEAMQQSADAEVLMLVSQMGRGQEVAPGQFMPPEDLQVAPVTVEDVWRETSGITANEVMREFGYEIASGSMANMNKEKEMDLIQEQMQTVMPIALQTGSFDMANHLMRRYEDIHEVPQEDRLPPLQPPQPPPGAGPPEQGPPQ